MREPFEVDPDAEIVAAVSDAADGVLGEPPAIGGASYWADAAFIAAAGIPTVLFGPSGEGAHARRGVGEHRRHGRGDAGPHRGGAGAVRRSYMTSGRFSSGMCSLAPATTVQPPAS